MLFTRCCSHDLDDFYTTLHFLAEVIRTRQMIFKDMLEVPGLQQFISRCETEEWGKELQKTLRLLKMDPNAGFKSKKLCRL